MRTALNLARLSVTVAWSIVPNLAASVLWLLGDPSANMTPQWPKKPTTRPLVRSGVYHTSPLRSLWLTKWRSIGLLSPAAAVTIETGADWYGWQAS